MPLPIPSLDSRTFTELVEEGRSLLPRLAPPWTDHNIHDPGITFLELFAWLVEMDIYRLDYTPEASERAFLRLLGIEVRGAHQASAVLLFSSAAAMLLPIASQITDAGGSVVFQTTRDLHISPAKLVSVKTGTENGDVEFVAINQPDGKLYLPFGPQTEPGRALYLGFDQRLASTPEEISLYIWTGSDADDNTRARLIHEWNEAVADYGGDCVPHWTLHYSIRTVWEYRASGGTWAGLADVNDETRALTLSGFVRFTAPMDHEPDGGQFRIRCRILSGVYECLPQVDAVALNAARARHEADVPEQAIGTGNGRAGQIFALAPKPVAPGSTHVRVMVGNVEDEAWREALVWDLAGPHDRAYVLSPETGEIEFGDGRVGRPLRAKAEVRCAWRTGGGPAGNVEAGRLTIAPSGVTIAQPFAATGGAAAQTLEQAQARALAEMAEVHRAITLADFETLALATPGVPVARARALAEYHPALPCFVAAGCVTVVVVPFCPDRKPEPGPDFLAAVKRYLERRRTLGTEVHLIGPSYTPVVVFARLHVSPGANTSAVRKQALATLNEFFHPLRGGPEGTGWPIGRDVFRSETMALLARLLEVEFVDEFGLMTEGDAEPRCGNLPVCRHNLVAAGEHRIQIVERRSAR